VTAGRRRGRIVSAMATAILTLVMLVGAGVRIAQADERQAEAAAATAEGEDHHDAAAEHSEEAPSIDGKKFALQLVNFGVLLAILIKFGGSAVNKALATRHEQLKAEVEVEKAHLISAAEERAKRIREETAFVVEQQIKEAQVALRREVADSALRIAEETLRRGVTAEDQRRMVEGFMSEVVGPEPLVPSVPTGKGI